MISPRRPSSIFGLAICLIKARGLLGSALGCLAVLLVIALVVAIVLIRSCSLGAPVRVGSFNIENFPRSAEQVRGAFEAIRDLEAELVAVQEITDPEAFASAARARLGSSWRFAYNRRGPRQRLGVLYDSSRWELLEVQLHTGTSLGGKHKPTLEAVLRPRDTGSAGDEDERLRVLVVHLKSGGDAHEIRRQQLARLEVILERALSEGDRLVVAGDFNATGEADRQAIDDLAERQGLLWASEPLDCTAYWARRDGCMGSSLDHMLTTGAALGITAAGPCETEGCDPGERCPIFHREVSDHCPIVADLL